MTGASVALFTRDLRVRDNPVLTAAHRDGGAVAPLFVLDDAILAGDSCSPNRAYFLAAALRELDAELRALGARLIVRAGEVAEQVARVAAEAQASTVHIATDVSGYSRARERRLRDRLARDQRKLRAHPASITVIPPGELRPSGRDHFAVFTPYWRRWIDAQRRARLGAPARLDLPDVPPGSLPEPGPAAGEPSPELAVGGETTGRKLLHHWLSSGITGYARYGDDLAADATSHLSPYLHFGCLSPAEVVDRTDGSTADGSAFIRQLAWRDFHHQVLAARPRAAWGDYRERAIRWRNDPQAVTAWTDGRTGFPIVDAGMRQLRRQGWMPNRARLITASFLTKSLRVDWRIGARHFRYWLVDADLADNQLNWQWVAGTGNDTRPNRVLNPLRQADRYDPDGDYVRRWVPELAGISGRAVHRPWRSGAEDYPPPIIECPGM